MDNATAVERNKTRGLPPIFSGLIEVFLGICFAWWFLRSLSSFSLVIFFSLRILSYLPLVFLTRFPPVLSRFAHGFSLLLYQVGFTILLLITDQTSSFGTVSVLWYIMLFLGSILPALSFFAVPRLQSELAFMGRPHMRLGAGMMLFGLGGIWSGVGAVITFNLYPAWWWIFFVVAGALVSALTAAIAWWWYLRDSLQRILKASMLMFWIMVQWGLLICFWPLGFLFCGLFAAWFWYIVWLTVRYYLSDDGIAWPRHGYFLMAHVATFIMFLVALVRWR
jgi:hypothetical protein